jgi:hypothetical protein
VIQGVRENVHREMKEPFHNARRAGRVCVKSGCQCCWLDSSSAPGAKYPTSAGWAPVRKKAEISSIYCKCWIAI